MIMLLTGIFLIASLKTVGCAEDLICTNTDPNKVNCSNPEEPQAPYSLPNSLSRGMTLQVLNVKIDDPHSLHIDANYDFNRHKSLQHLEISAKTVLFRKTLNADDAWNEVREELFNVESLNTLIIDGADFTSERHSWKLPAGLKKLVMINCNYTEFNLTGCPNLQYVDFSNNPLIKPPTFPKCTPNLETLILKGNNFLALSVPDVAKLCNGNLKLQMAYYSMGSRHRRCECQRLKTWFEKFPNYQFTPMCNSEANCEKDNLDEATKTRNTCLQECK